MIDMCKNWIKENFKVMSYSSMWISQKKEKINSIREDAPCV